jgi:hypothetical protein
MKRLMTVLFLCTLVLLMLTRVTSGVNRTSLSAHPAWADGSLPPPPFPPKLWADGSLPAPPFPNLWADGSLPAPPFPNLRGNGKEVEA